jgi:Glutamyl-tRNA reductase
MLERVAYGDDEVPALLGRLCRLVQLREAVVLSTCNRTEIYAACDASTADRLGRFLALDRRLGWDELRPALATETGQEAVRHLFRVAAGLDSMAVGDPQVDDSRRPS